MGVGRWPLIIGASLFSLLLTACGGSLPGGARTTTPHPITTASNRVNRSVTTTTQPQTATTTQPQAPTSASPATSVVYVAPVDARGQPVPGLPVSETVEGSCEGEGSSDSVQGPVYRCFSSNFVVDPCWAVATAQGSASTVLCMKTPWDTSVVKITTPGLTLGNIGATNRDYPWGVQLSTGQRCIAFQGAHAQDDGQPVNFACPNNVVLLGHANRSSRVWTYHSAAWAGGSYTAGPTVFVRIAWFGGPS